MGPSRFLLAEQSTMTTESGSDLESKPEQEAEPQEGHAGAQLGAQPGAEPGTEEQPRALEQLEEAAAHSTPVRKEVSLDHPGLASIPPRPPEPMKECLLSFSRLCSDLGLLALEGTTRGHLLGPFWSWADGKLGYFKAFSE